MQAGAGGAATLVVAPAGAGKRLGVAGWLRHSGRTEQTVWVTASGRLDAVTVQRLVAECRKSGDGGVEGPRLLVIDDAHKLTTSASSVLDRELNERPDHLRLLLLMSRWDLPLSRLGPELLGQLSVIRATC